LLLFFVTVIPPRSGAPSSLANLSLKASSLDKDNGLSMVSSVSIVLDEEVVSVLKNFKVCLNDGDDDADIGLVVDTLELRRSDWSLLERSSRLIIMYILYVYSIRI